MIHLKDKEIIKIAEVTELQPSDIQRLLALDLLDERNVFDLLIRYDYRRATRSNLYTKGQIIAFLMNKYRMQQTSITSIIYRKNKKAYYCTECGRMIPTREYNSGQGRCNECISKEIDV
jgi:hypothetical protein